MAVPQDPVVVAPAPAESVAPPEAAPAPSPEPAPAEVAAEPQPVEAPAEAADDEVADIPADVPADALQPEDSPEDSAPEDPLEVQTREPTPHTVTLVHRRAVSSSHYEPPPEQDSFERFFVSGYGGITTRGSAVSGKMGILRGFHGGLLLGERISIGVAYHRLKKRFGAPILDAQQRPMGLEMAYGGVEIGATVYRRGRFELGVQTLFGGGAACVTYDVNGRSSIAECVESVRMMVLEPSAISNVVVTDWMRVGFEAGYRGVARSQWRPPSDFDLGGGYFGLNLDFGWFARPDQPKRSRRR